VGARDHYRSRLSLIEPVVYTLWVNWGGTLIQRLVDAASRAVSSVQTSAAAVGIWNSLRLRHRRSLRRRRRGGRWAAAALWVAAACPTSSVWLATTTTTTSCHGPDVSTTVVSAVAETSCPICPTCPRNASGQWANTEQVPVLCGTALDWRGRGVVCDAVSACSDVRRVYHSHHTVVIGSHLLGSVKSACNPTGWSISCSWLQSYVAWHVCSGVARQMFLVLKHYRNEIFKTLCITRFSDFVQQK